MQRLWDTYAFGGFRVQPTVRGIFGNLKARIVSLVRRSKKRHTAAAQGCSVVGTTEEFVRFGDLSCGDTWVYLEFEVRRVDCRSCGKVKPERLEFLSV